MITSDYEKELISSAISGASKVQVIRSIKEKYDLSDQDIEQAINNCNFKPKPRKIDHTYFYNAPITQRARRIFYPFTQFYVCENFLSSTECSALIEDIDANLRPSTVADPNDTGAISDYRTSKTADLQYTESLFYFEIDRQIAQYLGLNPFLGELMQAQKYEPGQYYKEHWDFFMPGTPENKIYCEWMGQRTWTTMIYLNDVEEGGETYFKHLKLKIKPKQGTLLAWNNLYKNGLPNLKTMHEALPPISGNKYIITKWWRSYSLI